MQTKNIWNDSIIYLIGELFAKSLPFLMLPYLTRKLGPEGFGELSYYLTWLALFGIFVGLSQEGAVTRYYYFYGKKALNTIVKAGYLYSIIISFLLLIGCWLLKAEIIAYIVLSTMFQSFINVQLALRQCQKQPLEYIVIQIILSLTNVFFTIAALELFTSDLITYRILAIVLSNGLTFFIASIILGSLFSNENRITAKRLKIGLVYIFSFGLPLILHHSSFFMKGQLDRIFIYQQYTKAELGIYSAGVQVAAVLPIIFMALNKAVVPYYYQSLKSSTLTLLQIKKYTLLSVPFSMLPAVVGWFVPDQLYGLFLGKEYEASKYFTVIFLIGYGLTMPYLILANYLFYHAKNKLISFITFSSSLLYICALFIFSQWKLEWIPFALIISNLFMLVGLWNIVTKV